jgi:hypothetical protein
LKPDELNSLMADMPLPDHDGAEERGWRIVQAAYRNVLEAAILDDPAGRKAAVSRRSALGRPAYRLWGFLLVLAVGVTVISPARALVVDWVKDAVQGPTVESTVASTSPPGGGRLLVQSGAGTWVTNDDGSRRKLGDFQGSTWSPEGRFVAAVDGRQLVALAPNGEVRWALTRPSSPSLPSWNAPDGFRIAYLEGRQLRVVAGDGTGDAPLVSGVEQVRPSWRPGPAHELAFARPGGMVEALNADTGNALFTLSLAEPVKGLEWSEDGSRLLVWTVRSASTFDAQGRKIWTYRSRPSKEIKAASLRSATSQVLVLEGGEQTRAVLTGPGLPPRVVLAARSLIEPTWSSGGRRLMLAWPETDQWLFLRGKNLTRVDALSNVSSQFAPGADRPTPFPTVTGWCCSR